MLKHIWTSIWGVSIEMIKIGSLCQLFCKANTVINGLGMRPASRENETDPIYVCLLQFECIKEHKIVLKMWNNVSIYRLRNCKIVRCVTIFIQMQEIKI